MPFLYIGSTGDHAGYSLLLWALADRLQEEGRRVGFFKPFGSDPVRLEGSWADRHALLFKEVLGLSAPPGLLCPFVLCEDYWKSSTADSLLDRILAIARDLEREADVLLVMGARHIFNDDEFLPVPEISLISALNADAIFVHRYKTAAKAVYSALSITSLLPDRMRGFLINRVPPDAMEEVRARVIPSLMGSGVPVGGAVAEDARLLFKRIGEIREITRGEILCGEEGMDAPVGGVTVGSKDLLGNLRAFKRTYNKLVLLKPDSEDPHRDPAAPRPIAGIILTGGRRPPDALIRAAREAHLPLLAVDIDTFETHSRLERDASTLSSRDTDKVHRFTEHLDRDGILNRLLRRPGPA